MQALSVFLLIVGLVIQFLNIAKIIDKKGLTRWLAVFNIMLWLYGAFFFLISCSAFRGLHIDFGGGVGDWVVLTYMAFLLIATPVFLLILLYHKNLRSFWLYLPALVLGGNLPLLHLDASEGNEANGFQNEDGRPVGLYYTDEQRNNAENATKPEENSYE